MEENTWISIMDEMPPPDTLVETKGGYWLNGKELIIKDYRHSKIGDWMNQPGDPFHWRFLKE